MSWYSSKFTLVTKKGTYKNTNFTQFSSVYNSEILRDLTSQNEATATLNKDGPDLLRKAWKFA